MEDGSDDVNISCVFLCAFEGYENLDRNGVNIPDNAAVPKDSETTQDIIAIW